jgi:hypothetical protein
MVAGLFAKPYRKHKHRLKEQEKKKKKFGRGIKDTPEYNIRLIDRSRSMNHDYV